MLQNQTAFGDCGQTHGWKAKQDLATKSNTSGTNTSQRLKEADAVSLGMFCCWGWWFCPLGVMLVTLFFSTTQLADS